MNSKVRSQHIRKADRQFQADTVRLYRRYLESEVGYASPLAIDLCEMWGIDLQAQIRRLRPPSGWPFRRTDRKKWRYLQMYAAETSSGRWSMPYRSRWSPEVEQSDGEGSMRLLISGSILEVQVRLGGAMIVSRGEILQIFLSEVMPHTVMMHLSGHLLKDVVHHEALAMRPYRIVSACCIAQLTMITVTAPAVPFEIPFGSL